ncbi:MAG: LPP20 family lipoprotein [Candidatus Marinimicrobia bacterium]|nr:LPP20 family lipoprotein [Candidatus Neomarinimicrobiota bacterium]
MDRSILGRPFELDEILEQIGTEKTSPATPKWVLTGELESDTVYYGIGKSSKSQDEADDDARLRFAQHVEVSVQSIAVEQIAENKDRLDENYSYESLVSTKMNLRGVKIAERYVGSDSSFYSLIKYGKSEYHALVTREIQASLEADIRKQELAHQAQETLRADSLRHKIRMDSLALGRKQAVIDSLDRILQMEQSRQRQEQERIDLIKRRHADFLEIEPRYELIDVPSASIPDSWVHLSTRWNPESSHFRQIKTGVSLWLMSLETNLWATKSVINQGDISLKLQVLPMRGELYPMSLALGWISFISQFDAENEIDLEDDGHFSSFWENLDNEINEHNSAQSSFFVTSTLGIPQINSHASFYIDKRKISLANIWYPFPRNMGDAISIINQLDVLRSKAYRNRFNDAVQWQIGLRLIAIENRFATMIAYEDHEFWMLNFEFQY